jgi:hypothetical protein
VSDSSARRATSVGRLQRLELAVAAGLFVATTSGCTKSSSGVVLQTPASASPSSVATSPAPTTSSPPSPTVASSSSTSSPGDPKAAVTAAYLKYDAAVWDIGATTNDPNDPRIAEYTTGKEQAALHFHVESRRGFHNHLWGISVPHVQSVELSGTTATVRDCHDASRGGEANAAGQELTVGIAKNVLVASMVLVNDAWKVSNLAQVQGGTC